MGAQKPEMVQSLLEAGANPNGDSNISFRPIFDSLRDNGAQELKLLLEHGADPNVKNAEGLAPIFYTTNSELVHLLIDYRANVNVQDRDGKTPIMRVTGSCAAGFIKILVAAGAKTDLQDTNGDTALHYAVDRVDPESVAVLLAHKADPNLQNHEGYTPLDLARAGGSRRHSMLGLPSRQFPPLGTDLGLYGGDSIPVLSEAELKVTELLVNAGGLANLPKLDRIEVRRASSRAVTIAKDSHNWNQYSLLEAVAISYGIISQDSEVSGRAFIVRHQTLNSLKFPDFKKVIVYRRTDKSVKQMAINVNLEDIVTNGDCSRDLWLQWGDIVEIPEADHPINQEWGGLSQQFSAPLTKCISRQVSIQINGANSTLKLPRAFLTSGSLMLRSVLDNSQLIRVSSDLSRVKVMHHDPVTKTTTDIIVDSTAPNQSDLWLRDGDVIDVPEK
jgi:hypothetical protein